MKLKSSIKRLLNNHSVFEIAEELTLYMKKEIKDMDVLSESQDVINFAKLKIGSLKYETFMLIFTNTKNEVIEYEVIFEGTIDQAIIYPRRVIQKALFHDSSGLVIVHNHPSGHCYPSKPDKIMTEKLKECLQPLDVKLLDHIIVSKTDYCSFQEEGLL